MPKDGWTEGETLLVVRLSSGARCLCARRPEQKKRKSLMKPCAAESLLPSVLALEILPPFVWAPFIIPIF